MIGVRVASGDRFRNVGEVELDRTSATRLEVDEAWSVLGVQHVARMWLSVQELLWIGALRDRACGAPECIAQKVAVRFRQRWCMGPARTSC